MWAALNTAQQKVLLLYLFSPFGFKKLFKFKKNDEKVFRYQKIFESQRVQISKSSNFKKIK
jgi:hypothetical protein